MPTSGVVTIAKFTSPLLPCYQLPLVHLLDAPESCAVLWARPALFIHAIWKTDSVIILVTALWIPLSPLICVS